MILNSASSPLGSSVPPSSIPSLTTATTAASGGSDFINNTELRRLTFSQRSHHPHQLYHQSIHYLITD